MPCSVIIAAIGFVLVFRHRSILAHGRNSRNTRNPRNQSPAGQTLDAQNNPLSPLARLALGPPGHIFLGTRGGAKKAFGPAFPVSEKPNNRRRDRRVRTSARDSHLVILLSTSIDNHA